MRALLFSIVVGLGIPAIAQPDIDSLWSIWNDPNAADSGRLSAMHGISKEGYLYRKPDSSFILAQLQLDLARKVGNVKYAGEALNTQGISFALRGDLNEALKHFERALATYEAGNERAGMASALFNIGNVHTNRGDGEKGRDHMLRSLELSKETGNLRGMNRCLHGLGRYHEFKGEYDKALDLYEQSMEVQRQIDDPRGEVTGLISIGIVHKQRGDYERAIEVLGEALSKAERLNDSYNISYCLDNIGNLYARQGDHALALKSYRSAVHHAQSSGDLKGTMNSLMNLSGALDDIGQRDSAVFHHERALSIAREVEDRKSEGIILNNLGLSLAEMGRIEEGLVLCKRGLALKREVEFTKGYASSLSNIGAILVLAKRYAEALPYSTEALALARTSGNAAEIKEAAFDLFRIHKELGDPSKALTMFELHTLMKDSVEREENQRAVIRQQYKYTYEKQALADSLVFAQEAQVKDLEIQKQEADLARQRIGLFASGGGVLLIALLAWTFFRGKRRSDELLLNILPEEVAEELKAKGAAEAVQIDQVTVLFTDFKGFTAMAEQLSPKELVHDLNVCFSEFDRIMEKYGIEKIKTIGDAYMAAGGLPTPNTTHATDVIKAAFEMRDFVEAGKARKIENGLPYFEIRIGVHTGPVVAGIVGVKKFSYDIWGDTVNTASRMESSGEVGQVNISEATYELVKDLPGLSFTSRGKVQAKGKGEMEMYFVERG